MKNEIIGFNQFALVYSDVLENVFRFWTPQMQAEIARHCVDWGPGKFDFKEYLSASVTRFYKSYVSAASRGITSSVCDIGGFWGLFPLTLKSMGFSDVVMTEARKFYSGAFDPLFDFISDQGVEVIDVDLFTEEAEGQFGFDVITVMAVLEHYPHSLKVFMGNVLKMLNKSGVLYIEVPNIAYWVKRLDLLRGKSPLVRIESIFESETPFVGHHHEFTMEELHALARLCGLRVTKEHFYNYSGVKLAKRDLIFDPLRFMLNVYFRFFSMTGKECIAVELERKVR